jgi:hypothetical protein
MLPRTQGGKKAMEILRRLVNNPAYIILIAIAMVLASVLPTVILSRDKTKQLELALYSELSLFVDDPPEVMGSELYS